MLLHELADRYGPAIVFFNVMGAALGLPVPAMPTLIVVGASVAMMGVNGQGLWPHLALMLGIAVVGGVLGDLVWFQGGRRYGDRTLKTICKLSLSRDTCVKRPNGFSASGACACCSSRNSFRVCRWFRCHWPAPWACARALSSRMTVWAWRYGPQWDSRWA